MAANPEAVRRLAANPSFELGLHGWTHDRVEGRGEADLCGDLSACFDELERRTGRRALLYRPPYGRCTAREARIAAGLGVSTIEYDLPAGDSDPSFSAGRLTRWVVGQAKPGSIVIFHVNGKGRHTAGALPGILEGLRARGLAPVTVGRLLAP